MSLVLLWSLVVPSLACTEPLDAYPVAAWPDDVSDVPVDSHVLVWFEGNTVGTEATLVDEAGEEVRATARVDGSAQRPGWRVVPEWPLDEDATYHVFVETSVVPELLEVAVFTTGASFTGEIGEAPSATMVEQSAVRHGDSCMPETYWDVTLDVQSHGLDASGYRILHVVEVDAIGDPLRTVFSGEAIRGEQRVIVPVGQVEDPLCLAVLEEDTTGGRTRVSEAVCVKPADPGVADSADPGGCDTTGGGPMVWYVALGALFFRRRSA